MRLRLRSQDNRVTCAACAYATILGGFDVTISERQACDELNTDKKGTFDSDVARALRKRKIDFDFVQLNTSFEEYHRWLHLNSINRFIYLSCHFVSKSKRGRPSNSYHAVAVNNGLVYVQ